MASAIGIGIVPQNSSLFSGPQDTVANCPSANSAVDLFRYFATKNFVDETGWVNPSKIPNKVPALLPAQLQRLDSRLSTPLNAAFSDGTEYVSVSLNELIDEVKRILNTNPAFGVLEDVQIVGGEVREILSLEDHAREMFEGCQLEDFPGHLKNHPLKHPQRKPPDIDVRFIIKGTTAAARSRLTALLQEFLAKQAFKQNHSKFSEMTEWQLLQKIKSNGMTKFSNPNEEGSLGNRFLVFGLGNRKDYGFELVFEENLRRRELFSPEAVKISVLKRAIVPVGDPKYGEWWVWQGLTDCLVRQLHCLNLETLDKFGWIKSLSYEMQSFSLSHCLKEQDLLNKVSDLAAIPQDLLKFAEDHCPGNIAERLSYLVRACKSLERQGKKHLIPEIFKAWFATSYCWKISEKFCETGYLRKLSEQMLALPETFAIGYLLNLTCMRFELSQPTKETLQNLPSVWGYLAKASAEIARLLFNEDSIHKDEFIKILTGPSFDEDKWGELLLKVRQWDFGYVAWKHSYEKKVSTEIVEKLIVKCWRINLPNALNLAYNHVPSKEFINAISDLLLKTEVPSDPKTCSLYKALACKIIKLAAGNGDCDTANKLVLHCPGCPLPLEVVKKLYLGTDARVQAVLKQSMDPKDQTEDPENSWLLATPEKIFEDIANKDHTDIITDISRVADLGLLETHPHLFAECINRWIELILSEPSERNLLWDFQALHKLFLEHPHLVQQLKIFNLSIRLFNKAIDCLEKSQCIGMVGRIYEWLERALDSLPVESLAGGDDFSKLVAGLNHTLTKVIYDSYRIPKTLSVKIVEKLSRILTGLRQRGDSVAIISLVKACSLRVNEQIDVEWNAANAMAWFYAIGKIQEKEPLSVFEVQLSDKLISRLVEIRQACSPEAMTAFDESVQGLFAKFCRMHEKQFYSLLTNLLEIAGYEALLFPTLINCLNYLIKMESYQLAHKLITHRSLSKRSDEPALISALTAFIKGALKDPAEAVKVEDLLELLKAYTKLPRELWEDLLARSGKSRTCAEQCWSSYRQTVDPLPELAGTKLRLKCVCNGIEALYVSKSPILLQIIDHLDEFKPVFQALDDESIIKVYFQLLKGTIYTKSDLLKTERFVLLAVAVWFELCVICQSRPETEQDLEDLYYQLLVIRAGLKNADIFCGVCSDLGKTIMPGRSKETRAHQLDTFYRLLELLHEYDTEQNPTIYVSLYELGDLVKSQFANELDYIRIIEIMTRLNNFEFVFFGFLEISVLLSKKSPALDLLKAKTFATSFTKVLNSYSPVIGIVKQEVFETILWNMLTNSVSQKLLGTDYQKCLLEFFRKKLQGVLQIEKPYHRFVAISRYISDVCSFFPKGLDALEFPTVLIEQCEKFILVDKDYRAVARLVFSYMKGVILTSGGQKYYPPETENVNGQSPFQRSAKLEQIFNLLALSISPLQLDIWRLNGVAERIFQFRCNLLRLLVTLYKTKQLDVHQKAFIGDMIYLHLREQMDLGWPNVSKAIQDETARIFEEFLFMVNPQDRALFDCLTEADKVYKCTGIMLAQAVNSGFLRNYPRVYYTAYFMTGCHQGIRQNFESRDAGSAEIKASVFKELINRFVDREGGKVLAFRLFVDTVDNNEFEDLSYIPEFMKRLAPMVVKSPYEKIGETYLIKCFAQTNKLKRFAQKYKEKDKIIELIVYMQEILLQAHQECQLQNWQAPDMEGNPLVLAGSFLKYIRNTKEFRITCDIKWFEMVNRLMPYVCDVIERNVDRAYWISGYFDIICSKDLIEDPSKSYKKDLMNNWLASLKRMTDPDIQTRVAILEKMAIHLKILP